MTLTTEKYPLGHGDNEIEMPKGAQIVAVEPTTKGPTIFAIIDPDAETETRTFHVADVREELPEGIDALQYRGLAKVLGAYSAFVFETTQVAV